MISKDELITYLRKIIKLYNYEEDSIYNTILGLVIHCHLIEMTDDIKELFEKDVIDFNMYGGYIEFIDYLFDYNYLNEAYSLIKNLVEAKGFKTIDEYDNKVSIHTSLYNFFTKYFECIYSKFKRGKKEIVKEMEELIKYFYDTFKIYEKMEYIFLDKIDDYYLCTKKYDEAIFFFESKLNSKYCKYDVLSYLFNYFTLAYDYDECINMMDDYIENEIDTDLREHLLDLKLEFIES